MRKRGLALLLGFALGGCTQSLTRHNRGQSRRWRPLPRYRLATGVYHADSDPKGALARARRTIESCRGVPFTVTSMRGREYHFRLLPQANSGSPDIVLWSFKGDDWACDNAFVAGHNAAIGISTCAYVNGYDVPTLARDALKRIERLANTTT
jgi:hypothetical protein